MVMSLWPRFLAHPVCWGGGENLPKFRCFNENLYLRALSSLIRAKFGVWEWNVWSLFTHQISSGTVYSLALEGHKIWQNTAILTKLEMFEGALCPPSMPIKANLLCNSRIYNLCLHANYFLSRLVHFVVPDGQKSHWSTQILTKGWQIGLIGGSWGIPLSSWIREKFAMIGVYYHA